MPLKKLEEESDQTRFVTAILVAAPLGALAWLCIVALCYYGYQVISSLLG